MRGRSRYPLPTLTSQREQILDDWASGAFSPAALAAKYQAPESSIMGNIISRARAGGDPRALTMTEIRAAKAQAAATARPAAPKTASLADRLGIRRGAVVVKRDGGATSFGGRGRDNRITLSAGAAPPREDA